MHAHRISQHLIRFCVFGTAPVLAGCVGPFAVDRKPGVTPDTVLTNPDLIEILERFEDNFAVNVREAAERISDLQPDRRTQRNSLLWQTRVPPMMQQAVAQSDGLRGLLDAWLLALRQYDFFDPKGDGAGRDMFGEHQEIAVDAARRSLADIESVATRVLGEGELEKAHGELLTLAREYPFERDFSGRTVQVGREEADRGPLPEVVQRVLAIPIQPFRAIEGIDRGAAAIEGFAIVAARFAELAGDLPVNSRLQTQLLLLEMEELETIGTALASFDQFSDSAARMADAAEALPEQLRHELTAVTEDLNKNQAEVQKTLDRAESVVERVQQALQQVKDSAAAVEATAEDTARAGEAWTGTAQAVNELVGGFQKPENEGQAPPASAPAEAGEPFRIQDYERTAEALTQTAVELQELTRELRGLAGSDELSGTLANLEARVGRLLSETRGQTTGLIDLLTWRLAMLIGLAFVLLLVYRFVLALVAGRRSSGPMPAKP